MPIKIQNMLIVIIKMIISFCYYCLIVVYFMFKSYPPNNLINGPKYLFKRPKNTFCLPCFIYLGAQIILPLALILEYFCSSKYLQIKALYKLRHFCTQYCDKKIKGIDIF